jgi:hypothetical protein
MRTLLLALILAGAPAVIHAASDNLPWPAFTVTDGTGTATSSATFAEAGRAVVVFVKPSCRPCTQLLTALSSLEVPNLASQLVVVVEADAEAAAKFEARSLPQPLAGARVVADAEGKGWSTLDLAGLPVVFGVEGNRIAWTHIGAPERPLLESLIRTWTTNPGARR